ncbi:Ankyrin [Burkholderia vietnamiensis G4]|uniref:Ankyrin n=1 Tax=Burkholderia vietnamiensis (strain G4 / LMG 22486) TaxID=269482 RepID=A4JFE2_BURVG|nr:Ankyrin [Burkholderia vietnamiensis G4]
MLACPPPPKEPRALRSTIELIRALARAGDGDALAKAFRSRLGRRVARETHLPFAPIVAETLGRAADEGSLLALRTLIEVCYPNIEDFGWAGALDRAASMEQERYLLLLRAIPEKDNRNFPALHRAIAAQNVRRVRELLPEADLDASGSCLPALIAPDKRTDSDFPFSGVPLVWAITARRTSLVRLVLAAHVAHPGLNGLFAEEPAWQMAMQRAVAIGWVPGVKTLLAHRAPGRKEEFVGAMCVDEMGRDAMALTRMTPLMSAARLGYLSCVKALLPLSDPSARDSNGATALMHAASSTEPGAPACLRHLLPLSDVDARDEEGNTALMRAVRQGQVEGVRALLRLSDVAQRNANGEDAVTLAARFHRHNLPSHDGLRELLRHDATLAETTDTTGRTALHHLLQDAEWGDWWEPECSAAHRAALRDLLAVSDVNAKDSRGRTPLMVAARSRRVDLPAILLARGADPTILDDSGASALFHAFSQIEQRHKTLPRLRHLVSAGVPLGPDRFGRTPLMMAAATGHDWLVQWMLSVGCDPAQRDHDGHTALMFASFANSLECIELLLPVSDVLAKDSEGRCAAQIAGFVGEQGPPVSTRSDAFSDFFFCDLTECAYRMHYPRRAAECARPIEREARLREREALSQAAARAMRASGAPRAEIAGRAARRL